NSAASLRDNGTTFISKSLVDGLTAGAGVVAEPYVQGTPRPEVMMYYILNGYNLAESAWHSIAYMRWRNHVIGDPIYNPLRSKIPLIDSVFARDLIVFDYVNDNYNSSRNISVFLSESQTPEMAVFKLEYGMNSSSLDNFIDFNFDYRYKRDFYLDNLSSNQIYFYRVIGRDALGNNKTSDVYNFTTYINDSYPQFSLLINGSKLVVDINESINFSSSSNCFNCSYFMNFGNNDSWYLAQNLSWNYSQSGVYDVIISGVDNNGVKNFARTIVYVLSRWNKLSVIADTYDGNTSDFISLPNLTQVDALVLEKVNVGRIDFNEAVYVRGIDFDDSIEFVNGSGIFFNSSSLGLLGSENMNISFYNTSFLSPIIFKDDFYCFSCILLNNSNNVTKIGVDGFANYSLEEENLSLVFLYNYTYSNMTVPFVNDTVTFYADYLNFSSHIVGADCNISFFDGTWPMIDNGINYSYSRSFLDRGNYDWNISCSFNGDYFLNSSGLTFIDASTILVDSCQVLDGSNKNYILTNDILVSNGSNCIEIFGDNITFIGNNYLINGSDSNFGLYAHDGNNFSVSNLTIVNSFILNYYFRNLDNSTIKNLKSDGSDYGFYIFSSDYLNVENTLVLNSDIYSFYVAYSHYLILENLSIFNSNGESLYLDGSNSGMYSKLFLSFNKLSGSHIYDSDYNEFVDVNSNDNSFGFYLDNSHYNILRNVSLNNNLNNGFYLKNSRYNYISNSSIYNNLISDVYVNLSSNLFCNNTLNNVSGSGGELIGYYYDSFNLENKTFSQLIVCGGNNSILSNVSLIGNSSKYNNFLFLLKSKNLNLSLINSSGNYYGIYVLESDDIKIENSTFNENSLFGVNLVSSNRIKINNSFALENYFQDLNFYSGNLSHSLDLFNFTGSGNNLIAFYNDSVNLENKTFSQLILWNADNSNLNNLIIQTSNNLSNNG
ncbi:MAG: hypothetical protein KC550_04640, partial [Nanoarchaeota archaeon]|nr:hypothetical protein [Nanoarchaeota archaeon]